MLLTRMLLVLSLLLLLSGLGYTQPAYLTNPQPPSPNISEGLMFYYQEHGAPQYVEFSKKVIKGLNDWESSLALDHDLKKFYWEVTLVSEESGISLEITGQRLLEVNGNGFHTWYRPLKTSFAYGDGPDKVVQRVIKFINETPKDPPRDMLENLKKLPPPPGPNTKPAIQKQKGGIKIAAFTRGRDALARHGCFSFSKQKTALKAAH